MDAHDRGAGDGEPAAPRSRARRQSAPAAAARRRSTSTAAAAAGGGEGFATPIAVRRSTRAARTPGV
jgi:hypothetical protein